MQGDPLMTTREVAEYLRVSTTTILRSWKSGDLPGFRVGGRRGPLRFRREEIDAWLAGRGAKS